MRRELLIGCGSQRIKVVAPGPKEWSNLETLDLNPAHKPDHVCDLNQLPYPFKDNRYDEVHAYEVLEHLGTQGDWKFFFDQFSELHRILKPNGFLCASVPVWTSPWAWGDPSHTRVITRGTLAFLSQQEYKNQVGKTAMSDFRFYYKADFIVHFMQETEHSFYFVLKALK